MNQHIHLLASAVSSAVFQCLMNAYNNRDEEDKWFKQADKLEKKFITDYGKHYSYFLTGEAKT